MRKEIPQILYHYCSVETFYKIITSKSLWLTDSFSTNDYMENRWINKTINELSSIYINDNNRQQFENVILQYNINNYIPFIACFSEDGDKLSQWRAYANDGCGISIGFNTSYFDIKHHLPSTMAVFNENSIGLHEVYYETDIQESIVKNFLSYISTSDQLSSNQILEIAVKLKQYSYIFKNPAFFEEQEWRIIHTPLIFGNKEDNTTQVIGGISDCKYMAKSNDIVPYFLLSFAKQKDVMPISEIILGPKNHIDMYKIHTFLGMNNFKNVSVKYSKASYR